MVTTSELLFVNF